MVTQLLDTEVHARDASFAFLDELFRQADGADFAVRLWDGSVWHHGDRDHPRFTILLKHPGALRRMCMPPNDLSVGEAFIFDDFDVEGDVEAMTSLDRVLADVRTHPAQLTRLVAILSTLPAAGGDTKTRSAGLNGSRHSRNRDANAIRYHYDVSNEFYRLWLDDNMVYSCGLFAHDREDLDSAQVRKLDYICRKLRLKSGDRLLDIGCGWGGLVMHAAKHYGVRAEGITLSEQQASFASDRVAEEGLGDRCMVRIRDYRDIEQDASFDKIVSVGMFEHVGQERLREYFDRAFRALKPGGAFLNHGIAGKTMFSRKNGLTFMDKYVFPDGELVPINRTLDAAEAAGFEVRDVESLREHYALTLRRWVTRLEQHAAEALAVTDDVTYRIWRLFMAGSANGFASGDLNVYQTLLVKNDDGRSGLPLSRADWYAPEGAVE